MKTAFLPVAIAACALAGCATGTEGERMTVNEKVCIRSLDQVARYLGGGDELGPGEELGGVRSTALEFKEIAATWTPGDPPLDVRLWVDDAQLVHRIQNNCDSPETSLLVSLGGRYKLVDITLRPVPNPRPARRGRVEIIELPPGEADEAAEDELEKDE